MKKFIHIAFVLLFFVSSAFKVIQQSDIQAHVKTVFISNFSRYINWPSAYKKGPFVIGIFGDAPLSKELKKMAATMKVNGRDIQVVQYKSVDEIKKCHILYIPTKYNDKFNAINKKFKSQSILIITESDGMLDKGAGINFVIKANRRLGFELNKTLLKKKKMGVSYNLEALAVTVK